MRFRAKLAPEQVSLLHSLVVPLSKLSSGNATETGAAWLRHGASILCLDSHHLQISVQGRSARETDGILCFAELKAQGGVFMDFRIESAAEQNCILLELDLAQLRIALQSICPNDTGGYNNHHKKGVSAADNMIHNRNNYAILKLAKRQGIPCLCLEGSSAGGAVANIHIHHAIPVRVLPATERSHHSPPLVRTPHVQLQMNMMNKSGGGTPAALLLRTVLEKMRSMNHTRSTQQQQVVLVQGNGRTGELTVSLDSDGASIRTYFGKLVPVAQPAGQFDKDESDNATTTRGDCCTVKVDARKMYAALQWQAAAHHHCFSSAVICLTENEMLVVHVTLNPTVVGFFTYYVPVHYLSPDPQDE
jgi:HUS1 checkpoint protein